MRLIRGHKSTTILQKISDDSAAARAGTVRPKSRSILQFLARPATKSKGYGRLILRRKVASFCREIQVSTEKRGFVRFFLLRFLVDMYVCLVAHV
jgi:hypothetical protein